MADKLQEMYEAWQKTVQNPDGSPATELQAFQGGVTAGAVSMRTRIIEALTNMKASKFSKNALLTAVGEMPDIG